MTISTEIPRSYRCEAILITHMDGKTPAGAQCDAKAVYLFREHPVCWVHHQACHGPRANSRNPVEFVKSAKSGAA